MISTTKRAIAHGGMVLFAIGIIVAAAAYTALATNISSADSITVTSNQTITNTSTITNITTVTTAITTTVTNQSEVITLQNQISNLSFQNSKLMNQATSLETEITSLQAQLSNLSIENSHNNILLNLSRSTVEASQVQVKGSYGQSVEVTDFKVNYSGYLIVQETSNTQASTIQVVDSFSGFPNGQSYSLGTNGTLIIPILPGLVTVYFSTPSCLFFCGPTPTATISVTDVS